MVPSLTKGAFNEQENSYEDSDGSSCSKHGLSASTVKRYLKDHPEFLEKHIMQDVELEQLERWMIRRTQHSRKSSQSLGRNGRKTSLSRWKFCVHADKGKMLQDLTQSLQLQASKAQVLFELATCISSAVNADGFTLYIAESGDPENMSVYMGQSASGTNKMEKVKSVEGSYLLHVAKTKEVVRLSKGVPDDRFSDGIPKNSEIGHMLCQAIALPDGHLIAVVELFRCEGSLPFQEEDEEISLSYLVWSGIALQYAHLFMNMSKQRKLNDFLLTVLKSIFQEMVSLDMLVTKIMQFAKQLVDADRASLFLVDSKNQELYATIFDVDNDQGKSNGQHPDSDEIRFPIGTGIAGIVALKGETLNIQDVYSDARFNRSIDQKTGYKTETILCMPIFIRGSVIGVVQMVNKHSGCFTKEDEEAFEMFADYCGLALHLAQLHEELRLSEQKYKVALEVLSYHITSTEEELQKFLTATSSFIAPNNIDDFYFNPFAFDDMQKIGMAAHMFIDLFGLKRFDKTSLIKFTLTVKKNYRRVPYHNWSHGFCVANTAYSLIKSSSDRLALFIGSLCHDLDHRGKNNKFMLETESPLACIYSTSTMEHHHFNHTITILQQEGHNIFVKLSSSQYKQVLGLIKHCILATDLELHFTNKTELQNLVEEEKFTWSNHEHRLLIQAIAMTASDLSAAAKPFEVQKETVKRIFQEFYEQGDAEREAGITPIPMMDRNQPDEQAKSQIGFLKGVCIPCYSLLYRLIPESKPLLDMCQKNFERWQKIVEEMKKKQEKQESSG